MVLLAVPYSTLVAWEKEGAQQERNSYFSGLRGRCEEGKKTKGQIFEILKQVPATPVQDE
jgi:hypothetical protein